MSAQGKGEGQRRAWITGGVLGVGLLGALVALVAPSCTGTEARIDLPSKGESVAAFPTPASTKEQAPAQVAPLEVLLTQPTGTIHELQAINVFFDQAMPRGGDAPFSIDPPVEGRFQWLGEQTATFQPSGKLPLATTFTVTVPAGTRSAAGGALAKEVKFSFSTPGLQVVRWDPSWYGAKLKPDQSIYLQFNLPVTKEALEQGLKLQKVNDPRPLPVAVSAAAQDPGGDKVPEGTAWWIKPAQRLPEGAIYALALDPALSPKEGKLKLGKEWRQQFETYGAFQATSVDCGWGNCTPDASWVVHFTNPVRKEDLEKCITIRPDAKIEEVYGYYESTQLTVRPKGVKPGESYQLTVAGACKDNLGNGLARNSTFVVKVGHYPPSIRSAHGMGFMEVPPEGQKVQFPVTLRNTPDVNLRMLRLDEVGVTKFLKNFSSWWTDDSLQSAGLKAKVARPYGTNLKQNELKSYLINFEEVLGQDRTGIVYMDLQSDAYDKVYGNYGSRYHKNLVQVTDLGLTVKSSPETTLVWATSLSQAAPIASARVALRSDEGELLWEGTTDAQGLARAPGVGTFKDKKPRAVFATRGAEMSFLDLQAWETSIQPYSFGLEYDWDAQPIALRGFAFTERGVYRPGEQVHLKGWLRADRGRALEVLPTSQAKVTITDSEGNQVLSREVAMSDLDGFDLTFTTDADAPLGFWEADIAPLGDASGVQGSTKASFRVEAYRAPDFEVKVEPSAPFALVGEKASARLSGQYLFGAPMGGAQVSWSVLRSEQWWSPVGLEQYEFGDWEGRFWWYDEDSYGGGDAYLADGQGQLDANGFLDLQFDVPADEAKVGPQRLLVEATVTDVNRQVVTGQTSLALHPASYYVGLKRDGYLVEAGKDMKVEVVAASPEGQLLDAKAVKVEVLKREWTSIRKETAGGGSTWVNETKDTVLSTCEVKTRKGGPSECKFNVAKPGYFVVQATAKDEEGRGVKTTTSFYAWGDEWAWWGGDDAESVTLVPDKEKYKVGDTAKIMVQSPYPQAKALVTVERRGILSERVVDLKGSASRVEVEVTADMLPNAYVSVTLVRGRVNNPKDDGKTVDPGKPSFKIGYAELQVDQSEQVLSVEVKPERETYRPGEKVVAEVLVKDASGKPASGELAFMAVDEGVLSLTAYKTPNPAEVFFRKQPIAVVTSESRKAIVARVKDAAEEDVGEKGEDGGGGGGEAENFRSLFATTATFQPSVVVGADGKARVEFVLPDNLTAFRLMAVVAGAGNRFGSDDARVQVQKPLLVRPSLPRFEATGDDFELRAAIQSVGQTAGKVKVSAKASGPVEIVGSAQVELELKPGEVREVSFAAQVGEPGEATIEFAAVMSDNPKNSDNVRMKLPIKFPAVTQSVLETGVVQASTKEGRDQQWKRVQLPRDIRPDVGGLDIEIASSAMADLLPGLSYLVDYPYGCVEQTTGRALPLVVMREALGDFSLPGIEAKEVQRFAQSGLDRLWTMQTWEGGLGYWPGDGEAHPWGSAYGGLALVLASKQDGFQVNDEKKARLLDYLRRVVRGEVKGEDWFGDGATENSRFLAAWVLAEAGEPEVAFHNTAFERREGLSTFQAALLALAVRRAGGDGAMEQELTAIMLKGAQVDGAEAHVERLEQGRWYWQTMDSDVRSDAVALMVLTRLEPQGELTQKFARGVLGARRNGRWLSTQENAFAVISLLGHFQQVEKEEPNFTAILGLGEEARLVQRFKGRGFEPVRHRIPMKELIKHDGEILSLVREGGPGPLYYTLKLSYAPAKPPTEPYDHGFTLRRQYIAHEGPNAGKAVTSVKPGEIVQVRLTLVVPEDRHYVAIEDPLPAGLEPINTAFATTAPSLGREESRQNYGDGDEWGWYWWEYDFDRVEQRDDRVLLFANDFPAGVYSHTYLARATTLGKFSAPAARVEEMYNPDAWGNTEMAVFEVK